METLGTIFPLLLIVLVFWLLVIRPARRRQQEMTRVQNSVSVGSEVMLGSGIFGTVVSVADETVTLSVAPGTEIKVARQAVVRVVEPASEGTAATDGPSTEAGSKPGEATSTDDRPTDTPEQP